MSLANLLDLDDYRVKGGSVDFRGWPVIDTDGVEAGRIEDFIVDTQALVARYVSVALAGVPRTVVLPIGRITLDERGHRVVLNGIPREQLLRLPYLGSNGSDLDQDSGSELETRLFACFFPGEAVAYQHPHFETGPQILLWQEPQDWAEE